MLIVEMVLFAHNALYPRNFEILLQIKLVKYRFVDLPAVIIRDFRGCGVIKGHRLRRWHLVNAGERLSVRDGDQAFILWADTNLDVCKADSTQICPSCDFSR
jgi:hypothetical protein